MIKTQGWAFQHKWRASSESAHVSGQLYPHGGLETFGAVTYSPPLLLLVTRQWAEAASWGWPALAQALHPGWWQQTWKHLLPKLPCKHRSSQAGSREAGRGGSIRRLLLPDSAVRNVHSKQR